jgi:hypothetical protein
MTDNTLQVSTREYILRLLGMAPRPLRWAEMTDALEHLSNDARVACEWLMDHGYITPLRVVDGARRTVEAVWTLADKGLEWVSASGVQPRVRQRDGFLGVMRTGAVRS